MIAIAIYQVNFNSPKSTIYLFVISTDRPPIILKGCFRGCCVGDSGHSFLRNSWLQTWLAWILASDEVFRQSKVQFQGQCSMPERLDCGGSLSFFWCSAGKSLNNKRPLNVSILLYILLKRQYFDCIVTVFPLPTGLSFFN